MVQNIGLAVGLGSALVGAAPAILSPQPRRGIGAASQYPWPPQHSNSCPVGWPYPTQPWTGMSVPGPRPKSPTGPEGPTGPGSSGMPGGPGGPGGKPASPKPISEAKPGSPKPTPENKPGSPKLPPPSKPGSPKPTPPAKPKSPKPTATTTTAGPPVVTNPPSGNFTIACPAVPAGQISDGQVQCNSPYPQQEVSAGLSSFTTSSFYFKNGGLFDELGRACQISAGNQFQCNVLPNNAVAQPGFAVINNLLTYNGENTWYGCNIGSSNPYGQIIFTGTHLDFSDLSHSTADQNPNCEAYRLTAQFQK